MSLKCNMLNFLCTDLWACRALCKYETGLKFKDLLFSIVSRLNDVSQGGRPLKSFPTYLVAQNTP